MSDISYQSDHSLNGSLITLPHEVVLDKDGQNGAFFGLEITFSKIPHSSGVTAVVKNVDTEGLAAGKVKTGDVIVKLNDQSLTDLDQGEFLWVFCC